MRLLGIMITQRKHVYVNFPTADRIDHTVLISDSTAPQAMHFPFQRFRLAYASERVLKNVGQQSRNAFHNAHVPCLLPICQSSSAFGKNFISIYPPTR